MSVLLMVYHPMCDFWRLWCTLLVVQIGEYLGKEIHYKDGFCVQVRLEN